MRGLVLSRFAFSRLGCKVTKPLIPRVITQGIRLSPRKGGSEWVSLPFFVDPIFNPAFKLQS